MNFLQILSLVKMAMPLIIMVVNGMEDAIPGEGEGEQKLAMAREFLETVFEDDGIFDKLWPVVEMIINTKVASYNESGVFKSSGFEH
jgi:hypothetical protein